MCWICFEHGHLIRAELPRHICRSYAEYLSWHLLTRPETETSKQHQRLFLKAVGTVGQLTVVTLLVITGSSFSLRFRNFRHVGAIQSCLDRQWKVVQTRVPLHSRRDSRYWMSEAHDHMPSSMLQQPEGRVCHPFLWASFCLKVLDFYHFQYEIIQSPTKSTKTPTHLCASHVDTAALSPKFCSGVGIRSVQNRFHMKGWEGGKVILLSRVQRPKSHVATSSYLSVWICCVWWDFMQKHH